ncbi:LysE family translocator [Halobacillus shinanisalinarum]|uniref:LysE family translocator n=1 Tax=Halobacillus shinanisalinarum TaxID=2932258 RepID=A0ABY4GYG6_9BACI|nr:LysE family translocator [Halobacillus shinanisalinarum]UOQ93124.1 LysE family translocator [Halobacillus shinanisalinarum]
MRKIWKISCVSSFIMVFLILWMYFQTDLLGSNISWYTFVPAAIVMAATPGANQILSLRNGYVKSPSVAIKAVSGRFFAFILMIGSVALGLGSLMASSSVFFQIVKWIGVIYLMYLGIQMLRRSPKSERQDKVSIPPTHDEALGKSQPFSVYESVKQEFTVAATNPKAYILFAVFLPQFIDPNATNTIGLLFIVGLLYIIIEFICSCGYAFTGGLLYKKGTRFDRDKLMNRIAGFSMIGLSVWLATEKSPSD